ncbi:MAG: sensor histidine kinase [Gammaproteobacteria bacterium]|nr:sensor histidine kinase [Gammaproteobacteria bacterium]MDE2251350.1 sensor histidine kinase [Gammaproteobacteria bacterium]
MRSGARSETRALNLPDFCAAQAVLAVVLIVTLTAVVLAVARQNGVLRFWLDLARTSLFLLWTGLGSAAVLCLLRKRLARMPLPAASAVALGSMLAVIALVSWGVLWLGGSSLLGPRATNLLLPESPWRFFAGNLGIGAIVAALALRYFYVTGEWRRNVELQARARVRALQARIRPHFLFNSMNTIASLTRSDPRRAEEAVEDLADLFRANLSEQRSSITLKEELEVARIYQRIEQLRLGERLHVIWDVTDLPMRALVPGLLMQPLLENAIYHGIEPRPAGGIVTVSGALDGDIIGLTVRNPLPEAGEEAHSGNRIALDNIRERMELLYPGRSSVEASRIGDEYIVRLRFPYVEEESRNSSL